MNDYPQIVKNVVKNVVSTFPKKYKEDLLNECYITHFDLKGKFETIDKSKYDNNFDKFAFKRLYGACVDFIHNLNHIRRELNDGEYKYVKKQTHTLDDYISEEDEGNTVRQIDTTSSDYDLESEIENDDLLDKFKDSLSELELELINFRFNESLTYEQISLRTGIPTTSVRRQIQNIFK